jgi:5-hydroxyisourate hydrolase-like protein (transthyretin family)
LSVGDKTDEDKEAERITYAVTVTDQDTVPVGNVKMKIQKVLTPAEAETVTSNTPEDFNTDEWGLAYNTFDAGTYEVTVATLNAFGQNGESVVVSVDGEVKGTVEFLDIPFARTITVTLEEGQIAYIYGISAGDWVSFYTNVAVNLVG